MVQVVPSADTSTFAGAVTVKLPLAGERLLALMLKVTPAPGVPTVVVVSVVVLPGTVREAPGVPVPLSATR